MTHGNEQPWYRTIAMIALFPLVVLHIAYSGLCSVAANYLFERRVLSRMRRSGRYVHLSEAQRRIADGVGTLIIENPSIAWGFTRAWWSPEDSLALSPFSVPTKEDYKSAALDLKCEEWDAWCWKNYTCLDNGRACLLRVWNGASVERKLKEQFPDLSIVHTWTAFVNEPESPPPANNEVA